MMQKSSIVLAVLLTTSFGQVSLASTRAVPKLLNYQGYLTDTLGIPISDTLTMTFKIYDATTIGNELWSEEHTAIAVEHGVFSVILGGINSIPDTVFTRGTDRWLELTLEGLQTLLPRTRIASMAYAYTATYSDTAEYAKNAAADNDWVRGGTSDTVLFTSNYLGVARGGSGNVLHGDSVVSHINMGVACTTGTLGNNRIGCTISGGMGNRATHDYSTVCGGQNNHVDNFYATISGGRDNAASGSYSFVGNGQYNDVLSNYAAIVGGMENTIGTGSTSARFSALVGGQFNTVDSAWSFIGGGYENEVTGQRSAVIGGWKDTVIAAYSAVVGGSDHYISGNAAFAGGGSGSIITADNAAAVGGGGHLISATSGFVGGGHNDTLKALHGAILGGERNWAGDSSIDTGAVVLSGFRNRALTKYSIILGGKDNTTNGDMSTVAGGELNNTAGLYAFVGAGKGNSASTYSVIGGGLNNATAGSYAVVAGGYENDAIANWASVVGGGYNKADGSYACVAGGNRGAASGGYACVAGGYADTSSGDYSFSAGNNSLASYNNSAAFNGQATTVEGQTRVGVLSKVSGSFTIDHPLDPMNKILNHYFVESPEMVLMYRGSAFIGEDSRAVIHLPDYFAALNKNPMIQVSGVGTYEVFIAEEIKGDRFVIGGRPGTKVYWTVTGERQDPCAEITAIIMPVEQAKEGDLVGRSLDDDFLAATMSQLERMGRTEAFKFRTEQGRQKYEDSKHRIGGARKKR